MQDRVLRSLYSAAAADYDTINTFITLGLDSSWRKSCAMECASGRIVLDLCCGTGDLASRITTQLKPPAIVFGIDFNMDMLGKAARRMTKRKLSEDGQIKPNKGEGSFVGFMMANASNLPLKDECLDRIGISFAIRNLLYQNPKAELYLKEIMRVLSRGGALICVETSHPANGLFKKILNHYFKMAVPFLGWLISGNREIYQFLGESAANFLSEKEVVSRLLECGFKDVSSRPLNRGITTLYVAYK